METTTNLTAREQLAALVDVSKMFPGFKMVDGLQQEVSAISTLPADKEEEAERRAKAAVPRVEGNLTSFFRKSPLHFTGELARLRKAVDSDLYRRVEHVHENFTVAVTRPIPSFEFAARQYTSMAGTFGWARHEHAERCARPARERRAAHERKLAEIGARLAPLRNQVAEIRAREAATDTVLVAG